MKALPTPATDLSGRVAIVTGAAGGIGRATALQLAGAGAAVVLADRRDDVVAAAEEIEAAGGSAAHRLMDVTRADEVRATVDAAVELFGRLDVMVNNAGTTGRPTPLVDLDPDAFDHVLAVNAKGVFLGMKYALAPMIAQRSGSIVNVSSITVAKAVPELSAYGASKHAVVGLTRAGAVEAAPFGVRVNAILPGPTATRMIGSEEFSGEVPMGRVADPGEPAAVAFFLASDASSFVTGESILVDGGMAWASRLGERPSPALGDAG
jgi:NAD(P)-dependent dehydrogenase (short-subunit alcohol dehydrogenase family)